MQVNSIKMIGEWKYVHKDETYNGKCSVCKKELTNIEYDDRVIKGKCDHLFHENCFRKVNVIATGITLCPIDGKEFIRDTNFHAFLYKEENDMLKAPILRKVKSNI